MGVILVDVCILLLSKLWAISRRSNQQALLFSINIDSLMRWSNWEMNGSNETTLKSLLEVYSSICFLQIFWTWFLLKTITSIWPTLFQLFLQLLGNLLNCCVAVTLCSSSIEIAHANIVYVSKNMFFLHKLFLVFECFLPTDEKTSLISLFCHSFNHYRFTARNFNRNKEKCFVAFFIFFLRVVLMFIVYIAFCRTSRLSKRNKMIQQFCKSTFRRG